MKTITATFFPEPDGFPENHDISFEHKDGDIIAYVPQVEGATTSGIFDDVRDALAKFITEPYNHLTIIQN